MRRRAGSYSNSAHAKCRKSNTKQVQKRGMAEKRRGRRKGEREREEGVSEWCGVTFV